MFPVSFKRKIFKYLFLLIFFDDANKSLRSTVTPPYDYK